MKSAELLRLYESGRRDFRGEDLRGQNFKSKNLSNADFSGADIRSTQFTNATLAGASFRMSHAGLQNCSVVFLLIAIALLLIFSSLLAAVVGGAVAGYILTPSNTGALLGGWLGLAITVIFCVITVRQGIIVGLSFAAFTGSLAGAVVVAIAILISGPGVGAFAVAGAFAGAVEGAGAVAFAVAFAVTLALLGPLVAVLVVILSILFTAVSAGPVALAVAIDFAETSLGKEVGVTVGLGVVVLILANAYIAWRALEAGDERDVWLRSVAVVFAATGGTSFRKADLADADFSDAQLKSTDFRQANLRRTRWRNVTQLDQVRPGETYLKYSKIQQLLVTGNGQAKQYAHFTDLQGLNLQGANLEGADFSNSNLKGSTLQEANLVSANLSHTNLNGIDFADANLLGAKLIQAQLNQADLTGSTLTGAYIEDWGITTSTSLHGVCCDYVFMRCPPAGCSDPNPHRKPDDWNKIFKEGEFSDFIAPMVETLDLYHNQAVDPRVVAIAFHDLRQQNPDTEIDIISMEKRGKNRDKFLLRAEVNQEADLSQLHGQYFDRYEYLATLSPQAIQALLIEKDKQVQRLARMVDTAVGRSGTHIGTYHNQGDTTISEQGPQISQYDLQNSTFAGGFAETVHGNQADGTINQSQ